MPNQLPMAEIQAITSLYKRGWSCRRIARELGIHRETVGRYVRQSNRKAGLGGGGLSPGVCPEGGSGDGSKPAKAPTGTCSMSRRSRSVNGEMLHKTFPDT